MEESFPRTLESPLPRRPQSPWEGLVLGGPGRRGSFLHEKGWDSPSRLQSLVPAGSHEAAVHVKRRAWAEEVVSGSRAAAVVFAPGLFALTCSAGNTDFKNPSAACSTRWSTERALPTGGSPRAPDGDSGPELA